MSRAFRNVVAALIREGNNVLICQRREDDAFALLWEFPGGTVEQGEALEDAICREIKEELGVEIKPIAFVRLFKDSNQELTIHVHLFLCTITEGRPSPLECQDVRFVSLDEIDRFHLAPVDRKICSYLQMNRQGNCL